VIYSIVRQQPDFLSHFPRAIDLTVMQVPRQLNVWHLPMGRGKSDRRKTMHIKIKQLAEGKKWRALRIALCVLLIVSGTAHLHAQSTLATTSTEKKTMTTENKFYCNTKALNPAERARHKRLADKLVAERKQIVETDIGYEFQYDPSRVSIAEVAEWVTAESKCCPFFDFHIDLEREDRVVCLGLTGEAGVKPFLRSEFNVPAK
jgi:hypothetical protein